MRTGRNCGRGAASVAAPAGPAAASDTRTPAGGIATPSANAPITSPNASRDHLIATLLSPERTHRTAHPPTVPYRSPGARSVAPPGPGRNPRLHPVADVVRV